MVLQGSVDKRVAMVDTEWEGDKVCEAELEAAVGADTDIERHSSERRPDEHTQVASR